jgi:hypothetical protein
MSVSTAIGFRFFFFVRFAELFFVIFFGMWLVSWFRFKWDDFGFRVDACLLHP